MAFDHEINRETKGRSAGFGGERRTCLPRSIEFIDEDVSLIERIRRKLQKVEDDMRFEQYIEDKYVQSKGKSLYFTGNRRVVLPKTEDEKRTTNELNI